MSESLVKSSAVVHWWCCMHVVCCPYNELQQVVRVTIAKVVKIKAQRWSCLICITMQIVPGVRGLKPADWITVTLKNVENLVCATCHTPCNVLLFTSCSISHLHSNANRFTGDDIQDRWLDNVTPKNVKNLVCATCPTNDAVCCSLPEWRHLKPPDWINVTLISSAPAGTRPLSSVALYQLRACTGSVAIQYS